MNIDVRTNKKNMSIFLFVYARCKTYLNNHDVRRTSRENKNIEKKKPTDVLLVVSGDGPILHTSITSKRFRYFI